MMGWFEEGYDVSHFSRLCHGELKGGCRQAIRQVAEPLCVPPYELIVRAE